MKRLLSAVAVAALAGIVAVLGCAWAQGLVRFNPKTYKGKTGKITVPYRGESALFAETGDYRRGRTYVQFDTVNGTFVVPARKHDLSVFYAYVRSGGRVAWSARSMPKPDSVTVQSGKTVSLNIGPPFTAYVSVRQTGRHVSLDLNFVGRGGEDAQIERLVGREKTPGFQVLSAKGKILMKGTFEYG